MREAGIPPAVRARFLAEASSGLKRQQGSLRRLRLRNWWHVCHTQKDSANALSFVIVPQNDPSRPYQISSSVQLSNAVPSSSRNLISCLSDSARWSMFLIDLSIIGLVSPVMRDICLTDSFSRYISLT